jgi:glycosyltransferase involved in cell wall biosynthesis
MYDEEAGAATCVEALAAVLRRLPNRSRLVAVDDGSLDATPQILDSLALDEELLVVAHHKRNRGYGAALRTGAAAAERMEADWVLFIDSDLTNPPSDIPRFTPLLSGPYDYVKASRYAPGGGVVGVPWRRRLLSVLANRFARVAVGGAITDPTNGFRAVRTREFLAMPLEEPGFPIILEELYWATRRGLRCANVASMLGGRSGGRPSSFGYGPALLWAYARYTLRIAARRALRRGQSPRAESESE